MPARSTFSHWQHHDSLRPDPPQYLLPITWHETPEDETAPLGEATQFGEPTPLAEPAPVLPELLQPGTQLELLPRPGLARMAAPGQSVAQAQRSPELPLPVHPAVATVADSPLLMRPARQGVPRLLRVTLAVGVLVATSVSLRRAEQAPLADDLGNRSGAAAASATGVESCRVRQAVAARSQGQVTTVLTIVNTGRSAVRGWALRWTYPRTTAESMPLLSNGWNAAVSVDAFGGQAIDTDPSRVIPAGGSVTIGFVGTSAGTVTKPSGFALNGVACR